MFACTAAGNLNSTKSFLVTCGGYSYLEISSATTFEEGFLDKAFPVMFKLPVVFCCWLLEVEVPITNSLLVILFCSTG